MPKKKKNFNFRLKKQLTDEQVKLFKNEYTIDDHLISLEELEKRFNTNIVTGLTQEQADQKLQIEGPNCLSTPPAKSKYLFLLFEFLFCGFNSLLWFAALMAISVFFIEYFQNQTGVYNYDQLYFGTVVVTVIIFTGLFGFYQEATNVSIIDSFKKLTPKTARVIRDGKAKVIPSEEVVSGDLIELIAGEWIAADMRLVQVDGLKVDNSGITGESMAQSRSTECTDIIPTETHNIVFFTTGVVEGSGRGIVINRGDFTLMGRIANLTSSLSKGQTPLRKEINYFIKFVTILFLVVGGVYFMICLAFGYTFMTSFTYFIALVIANVPEGLPVTLTACMTLTCRRMISKNCLIKKLEAIETLGCCNVVCSDKTGTLTQNKMTVSHLFYDNQFFYVLLNVDSNETESMAFAALCKCAINCSRARFAESGEDLPLNVRTIIGDATEAAILKAMEMITKNVEVIRKEHPKVCEIPFNSTNKFQLSIHETPAQRYVIVMKGAPEGIIDRCDNILCFEKTELLHVEYRQNIWRAVEQIGQQGERVLAFADMELDPVDYPPNYIFKADRMNFPMTGLRFLGLVSMIDPPRPSVPDAVAKCKSAGIRVIMVTGDHPLTAAAIARQVGIFSKDSETAYDIAVQKEISESLLTDAEKARCNAAVYTGGNLREMNDSELKDCLVMYEEILFARTSPQQKLKIVEAFQSLGYVVAVTGDGINDSPALKKADIGIAMGIMGTDISKEAADMILLDDNFSSIVTGIEEGRLIFDNLKKSIAYLLSSNVPEIMPFAVMILLDFPPVVSVLSIMLIDAGTDLWPAISLAYEKAETDLMTRKPRNPNYDKLVNSRLIMMTYAQIGVMQTFASFASYLLVMLEYGFVWEDLPGLGETWQKEGDVVDSYGYTWVLWERNILSGKCYSGYFLTIVMTQIADLLICKTRKLSLLQQGMTNWVMNVGIVAEIALALIVVYCPGINMVLGFKPIQIHVFLLPALPFFFMIVFYDEGRKYLLRKYPHGLIEEETYY